MTGSAYETVKKALRVVGQHEDGKKCASCADDGCPELKKAEALTKPGEW
ncbi:hypothetical protein BDK92_0194 [Micromonospora pisi]|uniref:Uncharacterized protein n=1 Tax=Micromonospora pisi TaxID=589240 RepID=A0A495JAC2_9ACTN|nr:hypothetical protein BDK92_0194 [Micromonospora pisi]